VLLHGLVASGIYWGGAFDRLGEQHRLVVPDLLGFGRSPRPADGYGPDDHIDAIITCLDDLGIAARNITVARSRRCSIKVNSSTGCRTSLRASSGTC